MQRDYIMRMIEQAALIVRRLRQLIMGGGSDETVELYRQAASLVGIDVDLARAATPETLELMVAPTGEVDPTRAWVLAELLYLDGIEAELDDRPEDAAFSFERALRLYRALSPTLTLPAGFPEARERAAELEAKLGARHGPR